MFVLHGTSERTQSPVAHTTDRIPLTEQHQIPGVATLLVRRLRLQTTSIDAFQEPGCGIPHENRRTSGGFSDAISAANALCGVLARYSLGGDPFGS